MIQYGIFYKSLPIDESMVRYFGRHSCKQFIRSKAMSILVSTNTKLSRQY